MEIVRLAEPRPMSSLRPAAVGLAVLLNGGVLAFIILTREFVPPHGDRMASINILLEMPIPELAHPQLLRRIPQDDEKKKTPKQKIKPASPQAKAAAPRPGKLKQSEDKDADVESAPLLWGLVCSQIPVALRDVQPECEGEGDPFAAHVDRVEVGGIGDQSIRERPIGDILGGRFAGKDHYQIEVMLGLRSTSLGTKYHVPADHGPADEPLDLSDSDRTFGPSPIPDG